MLKKLFLLLAVSLWVLSCSDDGNGNGDGGDQDAVGQDGTGGDNGADTKKDGGGGDLPICN